MDGRGIILILPISTVSGGTSGGVRGLPSTLSRGAEGEFCWGGPPSWCLGAYYPKGRENRRMSCGKAVIAGVHPQKQCSFHPRRKG